MIKKKEYKKIDFNGALRKEGIKKEIIETLMISGFEIDIKWYWWKFRISQSKSNNISKNSFLILFIYNIEYSMKTELSYSKLIEYIHLLH